MLVQSRSIAGQSQTKQGRLAEVCSMQSVVMKRAEESMH